MTTTSITSQILSAVEGDPDAIRSLAAAVASGDVAAIQRVLSERGVDVGGDAIGEILRGARGESMTCTFTFTFT